MVPLMSPSNNESGSCRNCSISTHLGTGFAVFQDQNRRRAAIDIGGFLFLRVGWTDIGATRISDADDGDEDAFESVSDDSSPTSCVDKVDGGKTRQEMEDRRLIIANSLQGARNCYDFNEG